MTGKQWLAALLLVAGGAATGWGIGNVSGVYIYGAELSFLRTWGFLAGGLVLMFANWRTVWNIDEPTPEVPQVEALAEEQLSTDAAASTEHAPGTS